MSAVKLPSLLLKMPLSYKATQALRIEKNKLLPWYRRRMSNADWQSAMQFSAAFNTFAAFVFVPVAIVYVTDKEWKKKWIPYFYTVRKEHCDPTFSWEEVAMEYKKETAELERLKQAGLINCVVTAEDRAGARQRRLALIRSIERGAEE